MLAWICKTVGPSVVQTSAYSKRFFPSVLLRNYANKLRMPFIFLLQETLGPANVFFLFGAIALLSLVFVILNVPETKGLSLEEIESKILK